MILEELATLTGTTIEYDTTPEGSVMDRLTSAEVKEGSLLSLVSGRGRDRAEAARSYLRQISGKRLVVNAYGPDRREYQIP